MRVAKVRRICVSELCEAERKCSSYKGDSTLIGLLAEIKKSAECS